MSGAENSVRNENRISMTSDDQILQKQSEYFEHVFNFKGPGYPIVMELCTR